MQTQQHSVVQETFISALSATAENRNSFEAVRDKERIIREIQADPVMRQRWDRYSSENYYARSIMFDDVIESLIDLVK